LKIIHHAAIKKPMTKIILFTKGVKLQKRVSFMKKIIGKSQLNMMAIFKNLDQCMNVKLNFIPEQTKFVGYDKISKKELR
jgi:hypothetical protein